MQLTIDSVKPTAKSLVLTAGGKEYFAKKETGLTAGMTIEAEIETSAYNGKTYVWVKKFMAINGSAAPHTSGPTETLAAQARASGSAVAAPAWLPFASNTVAHAINAGIITAPNMVEAWARAAKEAFIKVNGE